MLTFDLVWVDFVVNCVAGDTLGRLRRQLQRLLHVYLLGPHRAQVPIPSVLRN